MAGSSVDLLIRVLADTSSAQTNVNNLVNTLGKVAIGGSLGGLVAGTTKASMDLQDAMARIQVAFNSPDFTPGQAKYDQMKNYILQTSTQLATSYDTIANVVAQGARYITESGDHLDSSKLQEYTDTMIRMSKISTDNLSPESAGRSMDVITKLFPGADTDFSKLGSEIAMSAQVHNQGEQTLLDAVIAIGQSGGAIGVTPEQAIGLGNFLSDLGLGGAYGGQTIGRVLQRMSSSSEDILDPEQQYANVKKQRDSSEKLSDLQTQLAIAEQKRQEMYGQHGLKTEYRRNPAAVMESDAEIAKLKREIGDQQQDMANAATTQKATMGKANMDAMAKLVGVTPEQFATSFQQDPISAFMQWESAVSTLQNPQDRLKAIQEALASRGGVVNARDLRVFEQLANPDRQKAIDLYNQTATEATGLTDLSNIPLGTTSAKVTDTANAARAAAAEVGDPMREQLDKGLTDILQGVQDNGFQPLIDKMNLVDGSMGMFDGKLGEAVGALGMFVQQLGVAGTVQLALFGGAALKTLGGLLGGLGGAAAGAAGAGGAAAGAYGPSVTGPVGIGNFGAAALNVGGALAASQLGRDLADPALDALRNIQGPIGDFLREHIATQEQAKANPVAVDVGGIHITAATPLQDILAAVTAQITAAWNAEVAHEPVSQQVGGNLNVTSQGPR